MRRNLHIDDRLLVLRLALDQHIGLAGGELIEPHLVAAQKVIVERRRRRRHHGVARIELHPPHSHRHPKVEDHPNAPRCHPRFKNCRLALEGHFVIAVDRAHELEFVAAAGVGRSNRTELQDPRGDIDLLVEVQRSNPAWPVVKVDGRPRCVSQFDLTELGIKYMFGFEAIAAHLPSGGALVAQHVSLRRLTKEAAWQHEHRDPQPASHRLNPAYNVIKTKLASCGARPTKRRCWNCTPVVVTS